MRNIDLDPLEVFKAVVDLGGIAKAAVHLNRVQSNVTTRIQNLEQRLGVQLFQRRKGRLSLAPEGQILLTYAERLLLLAAEAEEAMKPGLPKGCLRLGTLESTAASRLAPLLSGYHEHFPEVRIELSTGSSTGLVGRVKRCELDAAFIAEPFNRNGLDTQLAFVEELVLIAPKAAASITDVSSLPIHTVVAFEKGCSYRSIFEDLLAHLAVVPGRILELASYHAIVACVAAGSGVAIVPRAVLDVVQSSSEVHMLSIPPKFARGHTHLVWLTGHESSALASLRNMLQSPFVHSVA